MSIKLRFKILLGWVLLILVLIGFPMPEYNGTVVTYYDKFAHAFLFGIFSFLAAYALSGIKSLAKRQLTLFSVLAGSLVLSAAYSALCEFIQNYVPGRDVSELDFYAGVIGAVFGIAAAYLLIRKEFRKL